MTPWLPGHTSVFGLVFFVLKSLLGIVKQWSHNKHASLSLEPQRHVRIFMYWAIPENIHTQPRTASMFYPPLAFGNSKMRYPLMPSEFHNREPPSPSEFPFFWKYIFNLATPIWTNEHDFMPPQGCDLAAPGDKLSDSNLPLVDRLCKLLFRSEFGNKNKHH